MREKTQIPGEKFRSIDWDDIHRRLDSMKQVIEHLQTPDPDERRRILKERAELVALEKEPGTGEEECFTVMEFLLAYEHYAIEIVHVKEVLRIRELTLLPGTPSFVLGIINIRGEIFSIIDLKTVFNLPDRGLPEFNTVIVMRDEARRFGIVVDSVIGIKKIFNSALKPPPATITGNRAGYIKGVTSEAVIVLDGGKILADRGLSVHEKE